MQQQLLAKLYPDGFPLNQLLCLTLGDVVDIFVDVVENSGLLADGQWSEDDVRIAIRNTAHLKLCHSYCEAYNAVVGYFMEDGVINDDMADGLSTGVLESVFRITEDIFEEDEQDED